MIVILGIILSTTFFILSAIHFHWAFGGKWGFENSIPTNEKGEKVLNPKKIDSAVVGIGLSIFGIFYLLKIGLFSIQLPGWILSSAGWIISAIFIFRTIGEFKYIGFFKRVKNSNFAKLDSLFYSPLCLGIGLIGVILEMIK